LSSGPIISHYAQVWQAAAKVQYRRETANSAASIIAALAALLGNGAIASMARRA
jgi:hypothetical protein